MAARLEEAFKIARSELQCAAERRKRNYDLRIREQTYNVGDWVWYYCPRRYQRKSPKWQRMFSGPFLIVKCIRPANYVIQRTKGSQPKVVHADKLKLWNGDPPPSWLTEAVSEDPAPAAVVEPEDPEAPETVPMDPVPDRVIEVGQAEAKEIEAEISVPARPARVRNRPARLADYRL